MSSQTDPRRCFRVGMLASPVCLVALAAVIGVQSAQSSLAVDAAQRTETFEVALIGDLAYTAAEEPQFHNVMSDLNTSSSLAFVVHVGDLWGQPSLSRGCGDERYAERLALFQASTHPLIYTPGDNDWTDCHVTGADPLDRLRLVRQMFYPDEQSLGQQRLPLTRQSQNPAYAEYRENTRWTYAGVTFITLHVVGSNNNLGRTPEADVEWAERNAANLAWLHEGFLDAQSRDSRGVMVIQQAAPWARRVTELPYTERLLDEPNGFTDLTAALTEETVAFGRPVVLVHGDNHYFMVDNPLLRASGTPPIGNFTRVQTFGSPDHHWVRVTVSPDDPNVFAISPRMVGANLVGSR